MSRLEVPLEGGCLCGALRYRLSGHTGSVPLCHCDSCRRQSGAVAVAWLEVDREDFAWTEDEPTYYRYASDLTPEARRSFCGRCGSSLTWERVGSGSVDVATGSLDDPSVAPPTHHCWEGRQLDWTRREDGLPRYEKGSTADGD